MILSVSVTLTTPVPLALNIPRIVRLPTASKRLVLVMNLSLLETVRKSNSQSPSRVIVTPAPPVVVSNWMSRFSMLTKAPEPPSSQSISPVPARVIIPGYAFEAPFNVIGFAVFPSNSRTSVLVMSIVADCVVFPKVTVVGLVLITTVLPTCKPFRIVMLFAIATLYSVGETNVVRL